MSDIERIEQAIIFLEDDSKFNVGQVLQGHIPIAITALREKLTREQRRTELDIGITAAETLRTSWETPNTCNKCAEHLAADWSYCPECGTPQYEPDMGIPISGCTNSDCPYHTGKSCPASDGCAGYATEVNCLEIDAIKNAPLTLDELATRTKPVWVNADVPWLEVDGYYCLCNYGRITPPSGFSFKASDRNWVFYDHKPKGETE